MNPSNYVLTYKSTGTACFNLIFSSNKILNQLILILNGTLARRKIIHNLIRLKYIPNKMR